MDTEENDSSSQGDKPATYVAHFSSPVTTSPKKGNFEFESVYRASSKLNKQDARIRMLEIYGKDAVSWVIDDIRIKKTSDKVLGEQLELDFRAPKPERRRAKKKKWL